ncbi:MAG: FAD-binding protein [Chloroflexi bacterium]|nr:FAD-binding protein [Chloroflexota bacterium]
MRGGPLPMGLGPCNPPGGVMGPNYYRWSEDNGAEMEKGWIMKGRTVADLISAIGKESDGRLMMSAAVLEETVKTYNRYCQEGRDPDFHRPTPTLVPLDSPPFYAVQLWLGGSDTQGGPKRNVRGQVLHPDNTPIPGLYSAGDLGSFWGMLSHGGGPLAESYAVGHVAGANAAAEKPWDG